MLDHPLMNKSEAALKRAARYITKHKMDQSIKRLGLVRSATHYMKRCEMVTAEALQIIGPERLEYEDQAKTYAELCRICWTKAQWNEWKVVERHCSTMACMCNQILLQLA
jgi:hypothetical protein